jgi:hypothetical protein
MPTTSTRARSWRDYAPLPAPVLTPEYLALVLKLLTGTRPERRLPTAAAAALVGVSPRTVQRWMPSARAARGPAVPSLAHADRLRALTLPSERTLRHEEQAADYAETAHCRVAVPRGRAVLPEWREQGWLNEHVVLIVDHPDLSLKQVSTSRLDLVASEITVLGAGAGAGIRRRGGGSASTTAIVSDAFAATLLKHAILRQLHHWRLQPSRTLVPRGATQMWLADAPQPNLRTLVDELALG